MKRIVFLVLALIVLIGPPVAVTFAQSSPGWITGQIPTAAQWNAAFAAKQDYQPAVITTGTAAAPGSTQGRLEFRCGTNPGTAKIVAYAGTSATSATVLDNIGAGVSGC